MFIGTRTLHMTAAVGLHESGASFGTRRGFMCIGKCAGHLHAQNENQQKTH